MVVFAGGPSRADLSVRQCRRKRAGHVCQPRADGTRSAPGFGGHHHQLLCHPGEHGVHLSSLRIPAVPEADAGGHRRGLCSRLLGQEYPGQRFFAGCVYPSRGGGLRVRRRDGTDRKPGRQTGMAQDQAALSGRGRTFSQAHGGQQRGNAGMRETHRRAWRGVVQVDGHPARARRSARSGQLRAETVRR